MYPNSSQAFDVYQALVLQYEEAINKDNRILIFTKLNTIFDKIPSISSNLSFYEFEFDQIDEWKIIYKNSQKNQLIIFIAVLIFDLKISEIATHVKLSQDKAQFLFHQMFKKIAQNGSKIKYNDQLSFKKQNDTKISYLFTYENLIDYCLGQLPEEEKEKVKLGLELYPPLQITKTEYTKIINQIQSLKVKRSDSTQLKSKSKFSVVPSSDSEGRTEKITPFYKNKKITIIVLLTAIALTATVLQLSGLFTGFKKSEKTVVMGEVIKPKFPSAQSDIALESVPQPEAQITKEVKSQDAIAVAAAEPVAAAEIKTEKKSQVKAEEKVPAGKPAGGLYRASLIVKDLSAANTKMLAKIISLGATKAGEVELGWLKSNNMAYYHFIISEKNTDEVNKYLKGLGKLSIKFETHPRLIPAGNKRFIIEVKGN